MLNWTCCGWWGPNRLPDMFNMCFSTILWFWTYWTFWVVCSVRHSICERVPKFPMVKMFKVLVGTARGPSQTCLTCLTCSTASTHEVCWPFGAIRRSNSKMVKFAEMSKMFKIFNDSKRSKYIWKAVGAKSPNQFKKSESSNCQNGRGVSANSVNNSNNLNVLTTLNMLNIWRLVPLNILSISTFDMRKVQHAHIIGWHRQGAAPRRSPLSPLPCTGCTPWNASAKRCGYSLRSPPPPRGNQIDV